MEPVSEPAVSQPGQQTTKALNSVTDETNRQELPTWITHADYQYNADELEAGQWTSHDQPSCLVLNTKLWATTSEAEQELHQLVNHLVADYLESRLDYRVDSRQFQTLIDRVIKKQFTETVPVNLLESYQSDMYRSYAEVELTSELDRHIAGDLRTAQTHKLILILGGGIGILTVLGFLSSMVLRYHQSNPLT